MAGAFSRVACPECDNEQVVYGKAATPVECAACGETLATPTGGKAAFTGEVVETVEAR
ncbi:MAG TPA: 30S ribosomal protein S27e [Halobacteriales archaeon]|nr:30S ribosomal protein S27e [Halobacteriales archaeon]